jgi:hypothetical protein
MTSDRVEAFRWMVGITAHIPEEKSEAGTLSSFAALAVCYLIGREKECCEALGAIATGKGPDMFRKSAIKPVRSEKLRKKRLMTVSTLIACVSNFDCGTEREGSTEMIGMLMLLASLAVDASTRPFLDIVGKIIQDAALSDREVWQVLEREFPDVCRLIEADRMTGPEGEKVKQDLRRRLGISVTEPRSAGRAGSAA